MGSDWRNLVSRDAIIYYKISNDLEYYLFTSNHHLLRSTTNYGSYSSSTSLRL